MADFLLAPPSSRAVHSDRQEIKQGGLTCQLKTPDKTQMWKENVQEAEAGTGDPEHCPSSQRQLGKSKFI